ncbi:histidine kinase [Spirillospora sp. NPDC029432]|uniref:histidine kinase n=1 Tax=Spirillospora sp. NPDC029432 TaxID=3154599 RepID=UPI0034538DEE
MRCPQISALLERARSVPAREAAFSALALGAGLVQLALGSPSLGQSVANAAVACWTALLVPARVHRPAATLLATAPVLAADNIGAMAVLPIVAFSAARRVRSARRLWTAVAAATGAGLLILLAVGTGEPYGWAGLLAAHVLNAVLLLILPALSGSLLGRRRPLVRILRERNDYLERAQVLTADKARMQERARIAAEMHDMLGHRLSLISMHAGALELGAAKDAPRLSGQAELLRTTAATAMSELRDILGVLRDTMEADPGGTGESTGTRTDIAGLVAESRRAGIDVELAWTGPDLDGADPRTRHALHRVVREGLTNVHKHAPAARTRVEVAGDGDRVRVLVVNGPVPGERPRPPGTRQGLIGLDERIALIRGALAAGPTPEGGFRVTADLPCHPAVPMPAAPGLTTPGPAVPEPGIPEPGIPRDEPAPPLDAEALTLPRALGAGCLGLLALVPVAGGLVMLAVMALLQ